MDFRAAIANYSNAPILRHLILDLLKEYSRPNDKISELLKSGELIAVKRGMYSVGSIPGLAQPSPYLIANHLRGPSYITAETALSFWGFIPERTFEIRSATTKTTKKYSTKVGRFSYQQLPFPYYSFGIKSVELAENQRALIASPEKALCDQIIFTSNVQLRSVKQTTEFLLDDMRLDDELLRGLDLKMISTWLSNSPKSSSIKMLINTLEKL